jgi:hypothetical protein
VTDTLFRHHKGGLYRVLFRGVHDSNNARGFESSIVYLSLDAGPHQGQLNVRSEREFHEPVRWADGKLRPRFTPAAWVDEP